MHSEKSRQTQMFISLIKHEHATMRVTRINPFGAHTLMTLVAGVCSDPAKMHIHRLRVLVLLRHCDAIWHLEMKLEIVCSIIQLDFSKSARKWGHSMELFLLDVVIDRVHKTVAMNETGADDSDWVYSSCGDQADNDGGPWLQ
jgi:hypothetical protein